MDGWMDLYSKYIDLFFTGAVGILDYHYCSLGVHMHR